MDGLMRGLGTVSLIVIALLFLPSMAAFTPAIFISALFVVIALMAMAAGAVRRGVLSIYFFACTILASPLNSDADSDLHFYLMILPGLGVIFGVMLYLNYRKSRQTIV